MKFTYTETPGEKTNLHEWLAEKLKEHAKHKFGIELNVVVTPIPENNIDELKETS